MNTAPHPNLNPLRLRWPFFAGLAFVMLILWMSFIPDWLTFVHMWKVELTASIFLGAALIVAIKNADRIDLGAAFSSDELRFVILPMLAFIVLSAASAFWAASWRSAIHHALVWSLYLIFFCIVRYSLDQTGQYRKFLLVLAGTLVLSSLPAISGYIAVQLFGGANTLGIRFSRFGEQVAVILPLVMIGVLGLRSRKFAIGLTAVALLWLLVFCSMSRAGMLMFGVATVLTGIVILLNRHVRSNRWKLAAVAAVLLTLPLALTFVSASSSEAGTSTVSRLSDSEGISNSNDFRKLMIGLSLEMFEDSPLIGVGADNFGFAAQRYRESYALQNPNDPLLAQAESEVPERAHNEYLQILAELGMVGAAIFAWFLAGIGLMAYRAVRGVRTMPPHAAAAVVGIAVFLLGGLVTSYSFRLIQNGLVFFFVLAVASKLLLAKKAAEESSAERVPFLRSPRLVFAGGSVACLLLFGYSAIRVSSVILTQQANSTTDVAQAMSLYETAERLDAENPYARYYHGVRLIREERFSEAVPNLSAAIDLGLAPSDGYSYLATAQTLSGDNLGAEETMRKASVIYPRSTFVLVRYGILQRENGKVPDAASTLTRAESLGRSSARTWQTMIDDGFRIASSKQAADEKGLQAVMDLRPERGIHAVLTERLIKFPDEQRFSLFRALNTTKSSDTPELKINE